MQSMIFKSIMDNTIGFYGTVKTNALGFVSQAQQTGPQANPLIMNTSLEFNGLEITLGKKQIQITQSDYEQWKRSYTFDALRGARFGQSFCMAHDLHDMILWFERDARWCEGYIQREYVR